MFRRRGEHDDLRGHHARRQGAANGEKVTAGLDSVGDEVRRLTDRIQMAMLDAASGLTACCLQRHDGTLPETDDDAGAFAYVARAY